MADEPMDLLGGKTPMECADTPTMDAMACAGRMGMVQNVPNGMAPGSDVANLSVLGYDPARSYSGRSPLEALSVGVDMEEDDVLEPYTEAELSQMMKEGLEDYRQGRCCTAEEGMKQLEEKHPWLQE